MVLPTASDNVFPKVILSEGAAPATPSTNQVKIYAKADGLMYSKDDAGVETLMSSGASGGPGAWTSFTPTIVASGGGFSLGNGILQGYYKQLDSTAYLIEIYYERGSTTNNGSGTYTLALPFTSNAVPSAQVLAGVFLDSGTAYYVASGLIAGGSAVIGTVVVADATGVRAMGATVPVTLATGDSLTLTGILKV